MPSNCSIVIGGRLGCVKTGFRKRESSEDLFRRDFLFDSFDDGIVCVRVRFFDDAAGGGGGGGRNNGILVVSVFSFIICS